MRRDNVRVCIPRFLQIGKGSLSELPNIISSIGNIKSPLIVTDKQMVALGYIDKIKKILSSTNLVISVFDETLPDPTDTVVLKGVELVHKNNSDCVIGFGGGSPIDTAKAISAMAKFSKNIQDYKPP